jgi:undecaprenyl-diphosphatase
MAAPPAGAVTFLLTDPERSAHQWDMRAMAWWLTWAASLIGAMALTVAVSVYESPEAEADLIRVVQSWPVPGSRFSHAVRALTTTELVLVVGAVLVVVLWRSGAGREAMALAVLFAALPLAQAGLKQLVDRPRPDAELVRTGFDSPSFPAGHVMSPTVLCGALLFLGLSTARWRRWRRLVAVAWTVLVLAGAGIANVSLGVHWPSDVLGGYLWGLVLLLPAAGALSRRPDRSGRAGRRSG